MLHKIHQELNGQQLELIDIYHELKRILTNYSDKDDKGELKERLQ